MGVEDVSGTLDQVGTTWTELRKLSVFTIRERWRVTKVEPQRLLEFSGSSPGGGRATIREQIGPGTDGGTVKSFQVDYTLPGGPLGALLDHAFMHRKLERDGRAADLKIRALIDQS